MSRAREFLRKLRKKPLAHSEVKCPNCGMVVPPKAITDKMNYICKMCGCDVFKELRTMLKDQNLI